MVVRVSGRNIAVRVVGGVGEMETGLMKVTVDLQRELDKLTSDPIAVFVAEKRKELERKLYRLEHGKSSW